MEQTEIDKRLEGLCLDVDEFFKDAQPSTVHAEVMAEIRAESAKYLVDPYRAEQDRTWSRIANKVPGYEFEPEPIW